MGVAYLKSVVGLIVGNLLVASCATPTEAPSRALFLTKIEARRMGEARAQRAALDQLGEALHPNPFPRTSRPQVALSDMWFRTTPMATAVAGLCSVDTVVIEFDPIESDHGAETRARATGITSDRYYQFLTPPTTPEAEWIGADAQRSADATCAKLNPDSDEFFRAPGEEDAVRVAWIVRAVLEEQATQPDSVTLDCQFIAKGQSCQSVFDETRAQHLNEVRRCNSENCWIAAFGDVELRLYYDRDDQSERIARVVVGQLVVIADERRD